MRKSLVAVLALTACVAVSGCMSSPAPSPVPAPTFACTPEAGGGEHPCNEREYHEMKAQDALYLEAEQVYRAWWRERERLFREGAPADDAALAFTSGAATESLLKTHARGTTYVGGSLAIVWLHRNVGSSREGSIVSLEACVDGSSATIKRNGTVLGRGDIAQERVYLGGAPGRLKVVFSEAKAVTTCAR